MDNWYASYVVPITKHILLHYVYTASTWLHLSTIQSIFISFITFSFYYFFTSFSFFFLTTFYVQDYERKNKAKRKPYASQSTSLFLFLSYEHVVK